MTQPRKTLKKGDEVVWHSHGQDVHGTVRRKVTHRSSAAGRTVAATPEEPQYVVKSDKTGREAVHKPSALRHE